MRTFWFETVFEGETEAIWGLISHTALNNHLAGRSPVDYDYEPEPTGGTRVRSRQRVGPLVLAYEEVRFEWIWGQSYEVERRYQNGPLRRVIVRQSLSPLEGEEGGEGRGPRALSRFELQLEARPWARPLVGFLGRGELAAQKKVFERHAATLREAPVRTDRDALLAPLWEGAPRSHRVNEEQLRARAAAAAREADPQIIERLAALLRESPDRVLQSLRPLGQARAWQTPAAATIEAFLVAARRGLLTLRWDVLCPHCRGDTRNLPMLSEVQAAGFCPFCNLNFEVELTRSVEAVFTPHPAVREIERIAFCAAGPGENEHILLRRHLAPKQSLELGLHLPEGRHRVRITGSDQTRFLESLPSAGAGEGSIVLEESGFQSEDLLLDSLGEARLRLENRSARPLRLSVERGDWIRDALPASELTAMQCFRDLFGTEALAPGVQLSVGHVTILFTDLVESTRMYETLGDARAFRLVWNHFEGIAGALREHGGAQVKTIGDAVMAVFTDPARALAAALSLQTRIEASCSELDFGWSPALKVGLADGPALAVNLNDRLDYFGGTVNLAARVQGASGAGEVLVARETLERAGGPALAQSAGWTLEALEIEARGFDAPVPVLRLSPPASEAR